MPTALTQVLQALAEDPAQRVPEPLLRGAARAIFEGEAHPAQLGALLLGLRMQGESEQELLTFVQEMLAHAREFPRPDDGKPIVDTCGVGGDGYNTFNISTATALVVAAAGIRVAKHGNRSATSQCGSADVLEKMGYPIEEDPGRAAERLAKDNFCFLFARVYHPGMRHAAEARAALGVRTLFNLCGPLANPARPTHQLVGVSDKRHIEPMARTLQALGCERALVVRGADGLDEISLSQVTEGLHADPDGKISRWSLSPIDLGVAPVEMMDLIGGDAEINAEMVRNVIDGKLGPHSDVVNLNAAAVLWLVGAEKTIGASMARAKDVQQSGAAGRLLDKILREA